MDSSQRHKTKTRRRKKKTVENGYFMLSHINLSDPKFLKLPLSAQMLYVHLCRLRNRLTKGNNWNKDFQFFRPNKLLMEDTGFSLATLKRARNELISSGFISYNSNKSSPTYFVCDDVYHKKMDEITDKDAIKINNNDELYELACPF